MGHKLILMNFLEPSFLRYLLDLKRLLTIYFSVNAKTVRVPIAKHLANPHVNQKKSVAKNRS